MGKEAVNLSACAKTSEARLGKCAKAGAYTDVRDCLGALDSKRRIATFFRGLTLPYSVV